VLADFGKSKEAIAKGELKSLRCALNDLNRLMADNN
jgi:hypothetical protein